MSFAEQDSIDALVARLKAAGWKERDALKEELQVAALAVTDRVAVREHLELGLKSLPLEVRWEVEEVLEALAPPPPEPEEVEELEDPPEPEESADPAQLKMSDLDLVYDDPRGLMVYKHKLSERWFAVQPDPRSGQPQMFELQPQEVTQLKSQLAGSPYWLLGAGS
jgi:hypothetical protein